ncbi:MAG TPA: hypothetical protein VF818_02745 [Ktedonobacterales bacterium]
MKGKGVPLIGGAILLGLLVWWAVSSSAVASPIASATISPSNGSSVSGVANFVPTSDGHSTSVTTRLTGMQADAVYAVTVNQGACLGPRLFILTGVTADNSGQGSSTTTVPAQPQNTWYIAVHSSASPDAPLVACGPVRVSGQTGSYVPASTPAQPADRNAVENQQPYQLPNGGGGPPKTPIPTPVAGH